MNTKRRWPIIVCLLAVFGVIAWNLSEPDKSIRLSDGTTLRLLGVTTGTNHFNKEGALRAFARKVLPLRYQGYFSPMPSAQWGYLNGATFWFELRNQTNGLGAPVWGRAETESRDGDILPAPNSESIMFNQGQFFGIGMDCFPRRDRAFRYRIYDGKNNLLGEIRLPNPFRGPFPEWQPDPLPLTRTNGDLTATLRDVRKFMEVISSRRTNVSFRTDVEFRWRGVPTTNWQTGPCFVEDATGNSIGWLHPGLPASETVWRWRVWMERRKDAPVTPEERFVITNLPVPSAGSWTLLNITTNVLGLDFWIGAWVGPSTLTLSNGYPFQIALPSQGEDWKELAWGFSSGAFIKSNIIHRPTLIATVQENGIEIRANVVFRDQNGRLLARDEDPKAPYSTGYMQVRPGGPQIDERFYRPALDETVRSISVEVTVQRRHEMTFFITPPSEGRWIGRRPDAPAR